MSCRPLGLPVAADLKVRTTFCNALLLRPYQPDTPVDGREIQLAATVADAAAQPARRHLAGDGDGKIGRDAAVQRVRAQFRIEDARQRQREPAVRGLAAVAL